MPATPFASWGALIKWRCGSTRAARFPILRFAFSTFPLPPPPPPPPLTPRVFLCEHGATPNNAVAHQRNRRCTNNDGLTKRDEKQRDNERETEKTTVGEFVERIEADDLYALRENENRGWIMAHLEAEKTKLLFLYSNGKLHIAA